MITICLPVYNFNISTLISELSKQAKLLSVPYEIIIIDDRSDQYTAINKNVCKDFTFIELPNNIGRSKIRNLFLNYAQYDYLLFIDCDSLLVVPTFLSNYVDVIKKTPKVVCGGRLYESACPGRIKRLSWKYGTLRESKLSEDRGKFPNQSFMTNNFLINKKVLEEIRFDERITQYGHEDTLFGFALKKKEIVIVHINNPVFNGHIETNNEYLIKTKSSIINLVSILKFENFNMELVKCIGLLRYYYKVKRAENVIIFSFKFLKPMIVYLLKKGYVNLYLFDFYKLGLLLEEMKLNNDKNAELNY